MVMLTQLLDRGSFKKKWPSKGGGIIGELEPTGETLICRGLQLDLLPPVLPTTSDYTTKNDSDMWGLIGVRPTPIHHFLPLVFVYKKKMQEWEFDRFCWRKFQFMWTSKSVATHRCEFYSYYENFQKWFLDQPLPISSIHWSLLICIYL